MRNTSRGKSVTEALFQIHEYDLWIYSTEFESLNIRYPRFEGEELIYDFEFIRPRQRFLRRIKEAGLLDKLFTAGIHYIQDGVVLRNEGIFHIGEYVNRGKNRVLVLDKICQFEELDKKDIKKIKKS